MIKYKSALKPFKKLFDEAYKVVENPNKTKHENIQNTFLYLGRHLSSFTGTEDEAHAQRTSIGIKALIDDMNGELIHYFIKDKSLIQFLKSTEVKDTEIVNHYIEENSSVVKSDVGSTKYYSIALHTEDEGLLFTYLHGLKKDKVTVVAFDNDKVTDFTLGVSNISGSDTCKLAINLIYYMKAYPEKIIEGVPEDMIKNDKKNFANSKTYHIGIADELVEKTETVNGHIVIPHFRSGFFRYYKADRYKKMKGQVQFIAPTMVKGRAKTIVA